MDDKLSFWLPATVDEVRRLVNQSLSKSCSLDLLPNWFLKERLDQALQTSSTIVPTKMTAAPLLMKPSLDKDIMNNFRPISNISFISKRVVLNKLIDHISRNNLQETIGSAYKPKHSTKTALMRIQNYVLMTMDNKRGVN